MSTLIEEKMEEAKAKLEAKSKQAVNLILRVPTIHKVATAKSEIVEKAVGEARQYIAAILGHMADLVTRIREIQKASSEERAVRSKELKALEDEVLTHLNSGEELLANAARQAYALAVVSTLPPDKRAVIETIKGSDNRLPGLLGLKILEAVSGDTKDAVTVKIYGGTYRVNGGRDFEIKLAKGLTEGAAQAVETAREYYNEQVKSLKELATISVVEMLAKKLGRFFLTVSDVRNGDRFLPGGALLAESNGKAIKVLQARGHFQRIMTEISEAGIFVFIELLNRERFEGGGLSDERLRLCRILHAVLRRGIAEVRRK